MMCDRERFRRGGRAGPKLGAGGARPRLALPIAAMALLLGCAGHVPDDIRSPAPAPLTVSEARRATERHVGTPVRWGGSILGVENAADTTDVEILARPLNATGEPRMDATPQGRFIARFHGFLDPAEYPRQRLLTISGVLVGTQTRDVGEYPYRYPVVRATGKHLWPAPESFGPGPGDWGPWYPAPWYSPWYGTGRGPWWGPGFGPWYRPW